MASLLSLPDEIIDIIATAKEGRVGVKAWCRLTSTCRRLWRLQLPQSRSGWAVPSELNIEGLAWVLQRIQAAPWLELKLSSLLPKWTLESAKRFLVNLDNSERHMEVATAASRGLEKLRLLDVAITINEGSLPKRLASLFRQRKLALISGARNLEALTIAANATPCPPVLGCLPKLKYLELTLYYDLDKWLSHLFDDLSFCYSLESLRITTPEGICSAGRLPKVQLSTLPNLKRFELINWFSFVGFSLPPECELRVTLSSHVWIFKEQMDSMQRHLKVLQMTDMYPPRLQKWQERFGCLSRLQYLMLESESSPKLDLAELLAIPHVQWYINGMASLTLSVGAWQTLQVWARCGLCINFTDVDAFVRHTKRFLFVSSGSVATSQPMCASIREACSRQVKSCYQCGYIWQSYNRTYTVRVSNCERMMRLEPSPDGKITPSGGLHDGYAGTHEDSPLWDQLNRKSLVDQEQLWPKWEPHKWVFG